MGHIPKKSLLAILRTVATLGGKQDRTTVHNSANIYKTVGGTTQRLDQLYSLELLNRQSTGREFVYFVSPRGKQLLEQTSEGQIQMLSRNSLRENTPKKCAICASTFRLTWWKKKYFCPTHLNDDTLYSTKAYQPPYTSHLGWQ